MAKGQRERAGIQDDQHRERIARRAYERWEARGREDGRDQEDWFEAEREFEQGSSAQTAPGRSPRPGGSSTAIS